MHATLIIPARLDALEQITGVIHEVTPSASAQVQAQISLAVHELCVNIVMHAYQGTAGDIRLELEYTETTLHIEVFDRGPNAFDERNAITPDPFDLPEHGWGMTILRRTMDDVQYRRVGAENRWFLSKRWS